MELATRVECIMVDEKRPCHPTRYLMLKIFEHQYLSNCTNRATHLPRARVMNMDKQGDEHASKMMNLHVKSGFFSCIMKD